MKTSTCTRCKGKQITDHSVVHMGIPGGCYKCDLSGKTVRFTEAERRLIEINNIEKHLAQIVQLGKDEKAAIERRIAGWAKRRSNKGRPALTQERIEAATWYKLSQSELEGLRKQYRELRARKESLENGAAPKVPAVYASRLATVIAHRIGATAAS